MHERPPTPLLSRARRLVERILGAPAFDLALAALIFVNVAALLLEIAFSEGSYWREALVQLNDGITALFAVELSARFWIAPRKRRFFRRYWTDLVAIAPVLLGLDVLRVLTLLRITRAGAIVHRALWRRHGGQRAPISELSGLLTISALIVLVGAYTLHLFKGEVGFDAPGLESSLWFSVYTLLAAEPIGGAVQGELGRAVTLALMLGGMVVFSVFTATLSGAMVHYMNRRLEQNPMEIEELSGHVVIAGWNGSGKPLLQELFHAGERDSRNVVVITEGPHPPADLIGEGVPRERVFYASGDYTKVEVLKAMGIERCSVAILLADATGARPRQDRDARTVLVALTIERLAKNCFVCAELHDGQHAPLLKLAGVEEVVISDWVTGVILGSVGRTQGLLSVLTDLFSIHQGNAFFKVPLPPSYAGWTIGALHRFLKERYDAILVSVERHVPGKRCEQHVNPPHNETVQAKDILVIIARAPLFLPPDPGHPDQA